MAVDGIMSELVDLTDVRLADLRDRDDSVLVHSMLRVVEEVARPKDVVAGFSSSI